MTETLTVPTDFLDISELAAEFVERVDGERLMLYGPDEIEDGALVEFSVLLADGTPVLTGTGRAASSIDGGHSRLAESRFDIVLEELQMDARAEIVYERIVLERASAGQPHTGEVSLADVEHIEDEVAHGAGEDDYMDAVGDLSPRSDRPDVGFENIDHEDLQGSSYGDLDPGESRAYADAGVQSGMHEVRIDRSKDPDTSQANVGFGAKLAAERARTEERAPYEFGGASSASTLTRPSLRASWQPVSVSRPEPRASSGLFLYGPGNLPTPASPPRPDIDPSQRVRRAPHP